MDKREVLEYYLGIPNKSGIGTSKFNNSFSIDRALTALNKLEKEKMLEIVGENIECEGHKMDFSLFCGSYHKAKGIAISLPAYLNAIQNEKISYNKAKDEIRKKVRGL